MSDSHFPFRSSVSGRASAIPEPPLAFTWIQKPESGGSIRLVLAGELDLAVRTDLEIALDGVQDDSDRVLVDLDALTLIDCAALSVVFRAAQRSRREAAALILLSPHGQVRRLFDLVGAPPGVAILNQDDLPRDGGLAIGVGAPS